MSDEQELLCEIAEESYHMCVSLYIFFAPADSELDVTSCGLTWDRVKAEAESLEETTMEACDLFSETMESHSEDVEYFYIESKRVTERRKRERDNLLSYLSY